jgi:hypothetical protein
VRGRVVHSWHQHNSPDPFRTQLSFYRSHNYMMRRHWQVPSPPEVSCHIKTIVAPPVFRLGYCRSLVRHFVSFHTRCKQLHNFSSIYVPVWRATCIWDVIHLFTKVFSVNMSGIEKKTNVEQTNKSWTCCNSHATHVHMSKESSVFIMLILLQWKDDCNIKYYATKALRCQRILAFSIIRSVSFKLFTSFDIARVSNVRV